MNYVHFVANLIPIMPKVNCLAPVASLKCPDIYPEYLPRSHDYLFYVVYLYSPCLNIQHVQLWPCPEDTRFLFQLKWIILSISETNAAKSIIADSQVLPQARNFRSLTTYIISNIWDFITCPVCNFFIWVWKLLWGITVLLYYSVYFSK